MKQEVLGQPLWLWAVGAAVVVGGYLYFSRKSKASGSGAAPAPAQKSTSSTTLKETIRDWQGPPRKRAA